MNTHTRVILTRDIGSTPAGTTGHIDTTFGLSKHPMKYPMVLNDGTIINVTADDIRNVSEEEHSEENINESVDYSKMKLPDDVKKSIGHLTDHLDEYSFTITQLNPDHWSYYAGRDTHSMFNFDSSGVLLAFASPFGTHFAFFITYDGYDSDFEIVLVNTSTYNTLRWDPLEEEVDQVINRCAEIIVDAANPFPTAQAKHDATDQRF